MFHCTYITIKINLYLYLPSILSLSVYPSTSSINSWWNAGSVTFIRYLFETSLGGSVVKAPRFQCKGQGFDSWSGGLRSHVQCGQKESKDKKQSFFFFQKAVFNRYFFFRSSQPWLCQCGLWFSERRWYGVLGFQNSLDCRIAFFLRSISVNGVCRNTCWILLGQGVSPDFSVDGF